MDAFAKHSDSGCKGDLKSNSCASDPSDQITNLVGDVSEEIDTIVWNVYGKIERIVRTASSTKSDLEFRYDAMGNRICKIVKPRNGSGIDAQDAWTYTYYLRDASGNVIAVYDRDYSTPASKYTDEISLKEQHLYGSSRVGIRTVDELQCSVEFTYNGTNADGTFDGTFYGQTSTAASVTNFNHELKHKAYELSNHLGNVLVTVSDARTATPSGPVVTGFSAVVLSAQDYYAFGSEMVGRSFSSADYRYSFNGKEKDNQIVAGNLDFGARIYSSRLGRWLTLDPCSYQFADDSPYNFVINSPILAIDDDGKKYKIYYTDESGEQQTVTVRKMDDASLQKAVDESGNNAYVSAVVESFKYLRDADEQERGILGKVAGAQRTVKIKQTSNGNNGYKLFSNTVYWDPSTQMAAYNDVKTEGQKNPTGLQSPALGLYHEIAHAYRDLFVPFSGILGILPNFQGYDFREEKRVIEKYETPVAERLGEPTRNNHYGVSWPSNGGPTKHSKEKPKESKFNEQRIAANDETRKGSGTE